MISAKSNIQRSQTIREKIQYITLLVFMFSTNFYVYLFFNYNIQLKEENKVTNIVLNIGMVIYFGGKKKITNESFFSFEKVHISHLLNGRGGYVILQSRINFS